MTPTLTRRGFSAAALALAAIPRARAAAPGAINIDWATYNPVSLVLKQQRLLEKEFAPDKIAINWVQSLGSNKALEFLNASSIDFGSSAGAAALIARINGNPIHSVYVFTRPEWTALVTQANSPIHTVADLKGQHIAVTRGTDPHIFLVRALASANLSEHDVKLVLLQHPEGRIALDRGEVQAWAGLDPMMAEAELQNGDRLFFRRPEWNTWGVLNVREAFAQSHPDLVRRVLVTYETARRWAVAHPAELNALLAGAMKLPAPVVARQLERNDLSSGAIGDAQAQTIIEAGKALQQAGVLPAGAIAGTLCGMLTGSSPLMRRLLDPSFQAIRAIPSIAWVPLFILWLGIFETSKLALIALGVFFPVYLGTLSAIQDIDRKLIEVGRVFGYSSLGIACRITWPAVMPVWIASLRSGLGLGFMFVVAAELMGASEGLGYMLLDGEQMGRADSILVAMIVFALLGKLCDSALVLAAKPLLRWQDTARARL